MELKTLEYIKENILTNKHCEACTGNKEQNFLNVTQIIR